MYFSLLTTFLASLIPLATGFIWYNPKVFGTVWMAETGITEESAKKSNMPLIFGLTWLFSFFIAFTLNFVVIHQNHFFSVLAEQPGIDDANSAVGLYIADFKLKYGLLFRSFKHGALHGTLTGITMALPIVAINALFERRSAKYIGIHFGYWVLNLALMGGVICAFTIK
jgi:hypothetical protein